MIGDINKKPIRERKLIIIKKQRNTDNKDGLQFTLLREIKLL
jgi:hypothetical protein